MAVYTKIPDDEMESFVADYNIGDIVFYKGIAEGIENTNFLLQTSINNFILTIYEKRVNPEELPFFIELMNHLSAQGFSCPMPIPDKTGTIIKNLKNKPAVITSFLKGMSPRRISTEHCGELGKSLAIMHNNTKDFKLFRPNSMGIKAWRELYEKTKNQADKVAPNLASEIERELTFLEQNWEADLPSGVIHADIFPDNVFFINRTLSGIIDFYFACNDYFAYDLAVAINAWCFEEDDYSFNVTKARKLLNEYHKVRPLELQEFKKLPILTRGSALRFLLTRLYDWLNTPEDAIVTKKNPLEYIAKLHFHQKVITHEAYGLYL